MKKYVAQSIGHVGGVEETIFFEAADMDEAKDLVFGKIYWNRYGSCDGWGKAKTRAWFIERFLSNEVGHRLKFDWNEFEEESPELVFSNVKSIVLHEISDSVEIDAESFETGLLKEAYKTVEGQKKAERKRQYERLKEEFEAV